LVLGFEDHQPFPSDDGGSSAVGGQGGAGGGGGDATIDVLLIADRGEDAIGMYDPEDGTYLGDFVPPRTGAEPFELSSPNNAIQGPDGRIYVSDQLSDSVVRFEADGTFESVLVDMTDGVDNLRGIDFRGDTLFVSVSPGGGPSVVATFDLNGNRMADFVDDGSDPFDVMFLANGTMMLADIALDTVRLYDVDASSFTSLLTADFPQQLQPLANGNYLVAAWDFVAEYAISGSIVNQLEMGSVVSRGVHPLGNGQWLITNDDGIQAFNPFSKMLIDTLRVGPSFSKIERATLPASILQR
jgi:hypothetical protein